MTVEGRGGNRSGGRGQARERKRSWLPSTTLLFFRLRQRSIVDLLLLLLLSSLVSPFRLPFQTRFVIRDP